MGESRENPGWSKNLLLGKKVEEENAILKEREFVPDRGGCFILTSEEKRKKKKRKKET